MSRTSISARMDELASWLLGVNGKVEKFLSSKGYTARAWLVFWLFFLGSIARVMSVVLHSIWEIIFGRDWLSRAFLGVALAAFVYAAAQPGGLLKLVIFALAYSVISAICETYSFVGRDFEKYPRGFRYIAIGGVCAALGATLVAIAAALVSDSSGCNAVLADAGLCH